MVEVVDLVVCTKIESTTRSSDAKWGVPLCHTWLSGAAVPADCFRVVVVTAGE
jgi:hypothetical protein